MFRYRCGQCGAEITATTDRTGSACPYCGVAVSNSDPGSILPAGFILGGFEVIRKIGCGSSGNVYQANQLSMGRSVALKVLYSNLTLDRSVTSQFFEEVKILGQIQHPNIVCALEAGYDKGLYFLAMQYIAGTTLEEYLNASGPMKTETALAIIGVVAQALQYVWNKYHFCHRDIKPGNIMIDEDDKPVVLDFGTALRPGENSVRNGMIEGSPSYMSPEQSCGGTLTFSSDMYSLGVTFYHMLAGAVPYSDPDVGKVLQMHCSAPFPPFEDHGVTPPAPVVTLIRKMMAKTPEERYGSWEEFIDAFTEVRKLLKKKKDAPPKKKDPAAAAVRAHYARAAEAQAGKAPPVSAPPKKGVSTITVMGNLVSLLVVLITVGYVMARNNNNSALNQLENAKKAYNNVLQHGTDPDRALQLFKKAKSFSRKFGVKDLTVQEIDAAYETCVGELESMTSESKRSEELHLLTLQAIRNAESALVEAARLQGEGKNFSSKLKGPANTLTSCVKTVSQTHFRGSLNRDRAEQDLSLLRKAQKDIERMLGEAGDTSLREDAETAARREAKSVEIDLREEEEQKKAEAEMRSERTVRLQKDAEAERKFVTQYRESVRKELSRMERNLIIAVRKPDLKEAAAALNFPETLQTGDPSVRDIKAEMEKTLSRLRAILKKADPVLRKMGGGTGRREQIREAAKNDPERQYCAFLLSGYFPEASALMPEKDAELFENMVHAYLRPRIVRALNNARKGRTAELDALRSDYENFEPYRKLENELSSRM